MRGETGGMQVNVKKKKTQNTKGKKSEKRCESQRENPLPVRRTRREDGDGRKKKSDLMKTTAEVMAFPRAFTFAGGGKKVNGRYYYGMNNGYLH